MIKSRCLKQMPKFARFVRSRSLSLWEAIGYYFQQGHREHARFYGKKSANTPKGRAASTKLSLDLEIKQTRLVAKTWQCNSTYSNHLFAYQN